jgi:cardiolipin synthase A/B
MANVWRLLIVLITLLALMGGCASLPNYQLLHRAPRKGNVLRLMGARGLLSRRHSAAVLKKLNSEGNTDLLQRHLAFMQTISSAPLVVGNSARLLIDGPQTHEAMLQAISSARDHVNLETYILEDGELGRRLATLLMQKQAEGVQINIIYDAVGALATPAEFFDRLRAQGVRICEFNPINPFKGKGFLLNHRDHRKILVVDGLIAFTGGINISNVYSSASNLRKRRVRDALNGWRDTHIEVRGPAVAEFQKLFLDTWQKQKCAPVPERNYFPRHERQDGKIVRVLGSSPDEEMSLIYLELLSAITHAERSIHITMAYFVPDRQMIDALKRAARRGVEVKVILPGFSDSSLVFHAGRSCYAELLQGGVEIYERHDALLHAKTAVIDGVWSTVGSANMDWRSFLHNDEVNAVVLGESFAAEMARIFAADMMQATRIDSAQWEARGLAVRCKESLASLCEYLL